MTRCRQWWCGFEVGFGDDEVVACAVWCGVGVLRRAGLGDDVVGAGEGGV